MSEQEIKELAYLLKKAQALLTPEGKEAPEYITVENEKTVVGTSFQVMTGVIMDYKIDSSNQIAIKYYNCY